MQDSVIITDLEIMNGTPCFRGTRVPKSHRLSGRRPPAGRIPPPVSFRHTWNGTSPSILSDLTGAFRRDSMERVIRMTTRRASIRWTRAQPHVLVTPATATKMFEFFLSDYLHLPRSTRPRPEQSRRTLEPRRSSASSMKGPIPPSRRS